MKLSLTAKEVKLLRDALFQLTQSGIYGPVDQSTIDAILAKLQAVKHG